jgi:hypothetical protein
MTKLVEDHKVIQTLKVVSFYVKGTTDVETEESKKASKDSLVPLQEFMSLVKKVNDEEFVLLMEKYAKNEGLLLVDPVEDSSSMLTIFLTMIELMMKFLLVRKRLGNDKIIPKEVYLWFARLFVKYASFFRDSPNNGHMMYFLAKMLWNEIKLGFPEPKAEMMKLCYEEGLDQVKDHNKYLLLAQKKLNEAKKRGEKGGALYEEEQGVKKSQEALEDQKVEASQQMIEPGSVQRFVVKQIVEKIETNLIDGIVESEKTRETKILAYNVYYYNILMSCLLFIRLKDGLNKVFDWKGTRDNVEKVMKRLSSEDACEFFSKKYGVSGMKPGKVNDVLYKYLYEGLDDDVPGIGLSLLGIGSRELKAYFS